MELETMEEEIGKPGRAATMSMLLLGFVHCFDGKLLDMMMLIAMMMLVLLMSMLVGFVHYFVGKKMNIMMMMMLFRSAATC